MEEVDDLPDYDKIDAMTRIAVIEARKVAREEGLKTRKMVMGEVR